MDLNFSNDEIALLEIKAKSYARSEEVLGEFEGLIEKIKNGDMQAASSYRALIEDKSKCYDVDVAAPKIVDYYTEYREQSAVKDWADMIRQGGENQVYAEDMLDLQQSMASYEAQLVAGDEIIADLESKVDAASSISDYCSSSLENPDQLKEIAGSEMQGLVNDRAKAVLEEVKKNHALSYAVFDAKNGLKSAVEDLKIAQENAREAVKTQALKMKEAAYAITRSMVVGPAIVAATTCRDVAVKAAEVSADVAKTAVNKASEAIGVGKEVVLGGVATVTRSSDVILDKVTFGAYSKVQKAAFEHVAKVDAKEGHRLEKIVNLPLKAMCKVHDKIARSGGDYDTYFNQVRQYAHGNKEPLFDKVERAAKEGAGKVAEVVNSAKEGAKKVSTKFVEKVKDLGQKAADTVTVARAKTKAAVLEGLGATCEKISDNAEKYERGVDRKIERLERSVEASKERLEEAEFKRDEKKASLPSYEKKERAADPKFLEDVEAIKNASDLSSYDKNFALAKMYSDESKRDKVFEKNEKRAETFQNIENFAKSSVISAGCMAEVAACKAKAMKAEYDISKYSKRRESAKKVHGFFAKGKGYLMGEASKARTAINAMSKATDKAQDQYER